MTEPSKAFKEGFLYGVYAEHFEEEYELVANGSIPYAADTPEYDEWMNGYLTNLS